jgi:hypothetical protein
MGPHHFAESGSGLKAQRYFLHQVTSAVGPACVKSWTCLKLRPPKFCLFRPYSFEKEFYEKNNVVMWIFKL